MKRFLFSIIMAAFSVSCIARAENMPETEADSSDFITASLLIMQPDQSNMVSYFGHTALRLQCPSANLDFCFTFDSFSSNNYWNLLMGKERTSLIPVESAIFFKDYQSRHRKVYEHELNLTLSEERRLWQLIDRYVEMGDFMQTDYVNRGCAGETALIIASVVNGSLKYPRTLYCLGDTQAEIIGKYLNDNTWQQLMCYIFAAHDVHRTLADNEEKLMLPTVLEMVWKETTIVSERGAERPIFASKEVKVYDAPAQENVSHSLIRPNMLTALLLLFVIAVSTMELLKQKAKTLYAVTDGIILSVQSAVGLALLAFLVFSTQPTTSGWNCNIVPFNIVPLCVWMAWKRYGATARTRMVTYAAYAVVLTGNALFMVRQPEYFDVPQFYIAAAFLTRAVAKCLVEKRVLAETRDEEKHMEK